MTLADIAGWLSLSWETVKTVVQRRLENDYRKRYANRPIDILLILRA